MKGNITISKKEYFNLRKSELKLNLLETGGVDNWEYYGESLNPENEKSLNDLIYEEQKYIESL
jgi:hypothetical protein